MIVCQLQMENLFSCIPRKGTSSGLHLWRRHMLSEWKALENNSLDRAL